MKNIVQKVKLLLVLMLLMMLHCSIYGQSVPPAPPDGGHGATGNQAPGDEGGSAPVGSGVAILIGLGAAYAGKKVYNTYNNGKFS